MPTLLGNRPRLRLESLADRCLLSADVVPAEPIVVIGTDANDVITLTRLPDGVLEVTVQSFRDPEWTQPTDETVLRYQASLGYGELTFGLTLMSYPAQNSMRATTGTILVEAGAGNDRVEVVDLLGEPYFVSGTHRTDEYWFNTTGALVIPWYDGVNRSWAYAHDVWAAVIRESYTGSLVEGVDTAEGATVGVRFDAAPSRTWIVFDPPIWDEPLPDTADEEFDVSADTQISQELLDAAGLDQFFCEQSQADSAIEFDWRLSEQPGPDWTDEAGLADLWVEWAGDLPIHQWDSTTCTFDDDSDPMMSDRMDDWMNE